MKITIEPDDLRPLIESIVDKTIERIDMAKAKVPGDRLAYPESEASALIGVAPHTLRDARLRGEVVGAKVGKKILYERNELIEFLSRQRAAM